MIGFDLSELLAETGLSVSSQRISELVYQLSIQTSGYVSKINDLRDGVKPDQGQFISNLPSADVTRQFIMDVILREQNEASVHLSNVYYDNIFQVMIASGHIPIAWLHKTYPESASALFAEIKKLWDAIVSDYKGMNTRRFIVHSKISAFGMVTQRVVGHKREILSYFLIPHSQPDADILRQWIVDNRIKDVLIMTEHEYAEHMVNPNYNFLFRFDKIVDPFSGITFRLNTKLTETIPVYMASIGCDRMCFFQNKVDLPNYSITNNRYLVQEFKRGERISVAISVPSNYSIGFVSINGVSYFIETANLSAAGIQIIEANTQMVTGYKTYDVIISGMRESCRIYIDACEDLTGKHSTKKMISKTKSSAVIGDDDVTINLVFNQPFIFLNVDKINVYAKKDDMSEWELVEEKDIMFDGHRYVERKSVFGETSFATEDMMSMEKPLDGPGNPDPNKPRDNPYVVSHLPRPNVANIAKEIYTEARAILYGVTEYGSIIITFDSYSGYKYFKVTFDDRAMISSYKIPGKLNNVDVIPVIENYFVVNDRITEEPDDELPPDELGDGENPDNNGSDTGTEDGGNDNTGTEETNPDDTTGSDNTTENGGNDGASEGGENTENNGTDVSGGSTENPDDELGV